MKNKTLTQKYYIFIICIIVQVIISFGFNFINKFNIIFNTFTFFNYIMMFGIGIYTNREITFKNVYIFSAIFIFIYLNIYIEVIIEHFLPVNIATFIYQGLKFFIIGLFNPIYFILILILLSLLTVFVSILAYTIPYLIKIFKTKKVFK